MPLPVRRTSTDSVDVRICRLVEPHQAFVIDLYSAGAPATDPTFVAVAIAEQPVARGAVALTALAEVPIRDPIHRPR
ncbi:MAG: hypothetical protein U9Q74_00100 [Gemmatimonadota bacterium]|nr:hypothetical protein [Gemmatimonadota bacterium]